MEKRCNASFECTSADHEEVCVERRRTLSVADPNEEEKEYDHVTDS